MAIEQATLDRERNVALAKCSEGIVACNGKEIINHSEAFLDFKQTKWANLDSWEKAQPPN